METSSHNPTPRLNGGPESRQAVNANSNTHRPTSMIAASQLRALAKPRQLRNDQQNLESLLVVVFVTLADCFPGASQASHKAFDELTEILRRYTATILGAWGVHNPWLQAEDVVNELFVRFIERNLARRYDEAISKRRTYLFSVLRHVLAEEYRRLKPNRTVPLPEDLLDPTPSPEEALAMRHIRDQVSAAIGRLRPRLAGAVRCKYGFEVLSEDIAALSASARHSRTSRARKALRPDLQGLVDF